MAIKFIRAALEEHQESVGPSAVHEQDPIQNKPGITTSEDEGCEKVTSEVGEDHPIADFDEFDTVAESQETTLALEELYSAAMRYNTWAAAVEELADVVEDKLEAAADAGDAEAGALDETTVAAMTSAVDAAGVGEPLTDTVALEAFGFSRVAATESFVEELKARAAKAVDAIAAFAKKTADVVRAKLKRFADYFRNFPKIAAALEKEIGQTEGLVGRNFENAKREKKLQKEFYAPSSARTPIDVVKGGMELYSASSKFLDSEFAQAVATMNRGIADADAEGAVAAMNKAMGVARQYLKRFIVDQQYLDVQITMNFPEKLNVGSTSGMLHNPISTEALESTYDSSLKIAGAKDVQALKELAVKAERLHTSIMHAAWFSGFSIPVRERDNLKELSWMNNNKLVSTYRALAFLMVHVWAWSEGAIASALHTNFFAATGWVRASIAEAREQRKAAQ